MAVPVQRQCQRFALLLATTVSPLRAGLPVAETAPPGIVSGTEKASATMHVKRF